MILSAERPAAEILRPLSQVEGDLYLGFDVARRKDLSVIVALEKSYQFLTTRQLIVLHNTPFREQRELLFDLLRLPKVRRLCIDASGLGMNLAEDAQSYFGRYKVEGLNFTAPVKEELATNLRIALEDHRLVIPADPLLREDLHSLKRVTTLAGNVRFEAQRSETDGHADRFWALALANQAALDSSSAKPWVRSSHPRQSYSLLQTF